MTVRTRPDMHWGTRLGTGLAHRPIGSRLVRWFVLVLLFGGCATTSPDALHQLLDPSGLPDAIVQEAPMVDPAALEQEIHRLVNETRLDHGLHGLTWSDRLAEVSRAHSRDMARHGYFSHVNQAGADPATRAAEAGLRTIAQTGDRWSEGLGENIFLTHLFDEYVIHHTRSEAPTYEVDWKAPREIAQQAVAAWMQSPPHRANLLYPSYASQAIGVVLGPNQTVFVTQNFSCEQLRVSDARTSR